jgi:hypothetical protein
MSSVTRLLRFLRESWAWWVVPLVVMLTLTLILAALGQSSTVAPFDYGIEAGGAP